MEMCHNIDDHNYDVICISETWMKIATPNRLIPVPGYQVYRRGTVGGTGELLDSSGNRSG